MNDTPTPRTDEWEAYCDECYYHFWRLRRKTERGWYDGFHIHTGEEAKGLCDLLNNLEAELTAAREELKETKKHLKDANRGAEINAHALRINADKLIAVTEQRDAASAEFYRYHGLWDRATKQLETVMYQRDRLAEALERIGEEDGSPMSMRVCSTKSLVKQALQSLNPDHTVDANDMIPAVKGGSDE